MSSHLAVDNTFNESQGLRNTSCGIGSLAPRFLQKFANPKIYLIFFCVAGIVQGTYFTYLIGISSTLERRFAYDSKITGYILLADNISPAIFSIILGYFGRYIHKPRLVSFGMMINVLSCVLACCPYFFFGSKIKHSLVPYEKNIALCSNTQKFQNCNKMIRESYFAVCFLFMANFLKGIGSTAFYTIGTPYLDDNVKKKSSPMYLGVTFAMRVIGPTLGFWFSSYCLKHYENPFIEPKFGVNDPQWIGAWWIGFLVIGFVLFLTSFPILFFPRYIQNRSVLEPSKTKCHHKQSFWHLFAALKKLFANPVLIFHTLSIIFQINGLFGYISFMPKYIENLFHNSASSANFYSGTVTLFATAPVTLFSGYLISKFKPKPKYLTFYMMFVQVFAGVVMIAALFMHCQSDGTSGIESFLFHKEKSCNSFCSCNTTDFSPICDIHGVSHFSACSAGCYNAYKMNDTMVFSNCSCIPFNGNNTDDVAQASKGFCTGFCEKVLPYIIIITITKLLASSARVGNILVTLRCVDEADKTLALGAVEFFISIFATIPNPILYGYVFDKSCLLWEESCGVQGNCLFYDSTVLRYYIHIVAITFIFLGACCDFVVFMLSSKLNNLYKEPLQMERPHQELVEGPDLQ